MKSHLDCFRSTLFKIPRGHAPESRAVESKKLQSCWRVWKYRHNTPSKIQTLLSVVFPIKPFILFTIIKHKNVFFLATRIPKGGVERRSFPVGCFNQCPGENCWGKPPPLPPVSLGQARKGPPPLCGSQTSYSSAARAAKCCCQGPRRRLVCLWVAQFAVKMAGAEVSLESGWETSWTKNKNA